MKRVANAVGEQRWPILKKLLGLCRLYLCFALFLLHSPILYSRPGTNELICQHETFQLVRRFFRQALTEISEDGWQKMDALIEILVRFPINEDRSDGAFGLRLHFADIYLEELSRFEVSLSSVGDSVSVYQAKRKIDNFRSRRLYLVIYPFFMSH